MLFASSAFLQALNLTHFFGSRLAYLKELLDLPQLMRVNVAQVIESVVGTDRILRSSPPSSSIMRAPTVRAFTMQPTSSGS